MPVVYLTMKQVAERLDYADPGSALRFLRTVGVPLIPRGRKLLVREDRLDLYLDTGDNGQRAVIARMKRRA